MGRIRERLGEEGIVVGEGEREMDSCRGGEYSTYILQLVNNILYYLPLSRDVRLLLAGETWYMVYPGTHDSGKVSLSAGSAAGLSMLLYRSSPLALYVAWKALEVSIEWEGEATPQWDGVMMG